jgi:hypothetical protein
VAVPDNKRTKLAIYIRTYIQKHLSLQDVKGGAIFAPTLSHVINKTRVVGSRVDGSNRPQTTNTIHVGPTICLGGTHVRDPCGFMRYSCGTHIRWDPHILVCGAHNSIEWDFRAIFAPRLSHIINKTRSVGSRVDGSNRPQTTNIAHAGPTICLGGTHVDS